MTNALTVQRDGAVSDPETGEVVGVVAVNRDSDNLNFDQLLRLAAELVPTGFLPRHIKTPGQAVAIILTGRELGMGPMRALRSLQMVEGKVIESADSQLGRFKRSGGRAVFRQLTDAHAVLWLRHPNGDEHEERWTAEDAKAAGLAGKDNYKKYPRAMNRSRAITAGLKSLGWEGGVGIYDGTSDACSGVGCFGAAARTREAVASSPGGALWEPPRAQDGTGMPFGPLKGAPVSDPSVRFGHLLHAVEWAENDEARSGRFEAFLAAGKAELRRRLDVAPDDELTLAQEWIEKKPRRTNIFRTLRQDIEHELEARGSAVGLFEPDAAPGQRTSMESYEGAL